MIHDYTTCPGCVIKDSQIESLKVEALKWKEKYNNAIQSEILKDYNELENKKYPPSGYD